MPDSTIAAITPQDVYRALSADQARQLHDFCKIAKEHPAAVIADALTLHFDELDGTCHDATIVDAVLPMEASP